MGTTKEMKCPKDGTLLQSVRVGRVVLDKCHACDGIWCDHGELETLKNAKLNEVEQKLESSYGDPQVTQLDTDGYMRCPKCAEGKLNGMTYAVLRPMRVDRCDQCLGIWLDAGELDRALRRPSDKKDDSRTDEARITMLFRSVSQWFA